MRGIFSVSVQIYVSETNAPPLKASYCLLILQNSDTVRSSRHIYTQKYASDLPAVFLKITPARKSLIQYTMHNVRFKMQYTFFHTPALSTYCFHPFCCTLLFLIQRIVYETFQQIYGSLNAVACTVDTDIKICRVTPLLTGIIIIRSLSAFIRLADKTLLPPGGPDCSAAFFCGYGSHTAHR